MKTPAERLQELFEAAVLLTTEDERSAFVRRECGEDAELQARLERLLRAQDAQGAFLEHSAAELLLGTDEESSVETFRTSNDHSVAGTPGSLPQTHVRLRDPDNSGLCLSADESSTEIPPTRRIDHYEVAGEIARGGMGAVFWARDTLVGRDLAIKVLLTRHQHNEDMIRRFTQEAQITGQLQHPGIAPVHEIGQASDGRPFFSMKLVRGSTLQSLLSEDHRVPAVQSRLLQIFLQVCQIVAYAHRRGVIHRDLKPANIMVGAFGEVQVMDWGLAKQVGAEVDDLHHHRKPIAAGGFSSDHRSAPLGDAFDTTAGLVMGTLAYMSPEMARGRGRDADERTDVFSLGAILCEILTGHPPYAGDDIFRRAVEYDISDCLDRLDHSQHDSHLLSLAKSCLKEHPEVRVQSVMDLSEQVAQHLQNSAIGSPSSNVAGEQHTAVRGTHRKRTAMVVTASILGFAAFCWSLLSYSGTWTGSFAEKGTQREEVYNESRQSLPAVPEHSQDSITVHSPDHPDIQQGDQVAAESTDVSRLIKTERVFSFENRQRPGKFLDIHGDKDSGHQLVPVVDYTSQGGCHWKTLSVNAHCFRIKNIARDVFLDVDADDSSVVKTSSKPKIGGDEWRLVPLGDDCFRVVSEYWARQGQERVLSIDDTGNPTLKLRDASLQSVWRLKRYPGRE